MNNIFDRRRNLASQRWSEGSIWLQLLAFLTWINTDKLVVSLWPCIDFLTEKGVPFQRPLNQDRWWPSLPQGPLLPHRSLTTSGRQTPLRAFKLNLLSKAILIFSSFFFFSLSLSLSPLFFFLSIFLILKQCTCFYCYQYADASMPFSQYRSCIHILFGTSTSRLSISDWTAQVNQINSLPIGRR